MKKYYLTTPIYYVNDKPHVGHAYTTIAADVVARWRRIRGEKVFFLTGTDEHGSKIAQAAEKQGLTSKALVDRESKKFRDLWSTLNIKNDDFIRTTEERHAKVVKKVFEVLTAKGDIYKGFYEDWYCISCESFWLESELVEGNCPDCGRKVEKIKEETYYFKQSKYEKPLLDYYSQHPEFLSPKKRSQEIVNFVKSGLKDVSVSRLKETWGIPLPQDPRHTAYVWFDALLNYLSAAGYGENSSFETLWPADLHLVGKEIFRFHAILWPAMLIALDLPVPAKVFAHGWWTAEGEKMSKTKGNFVDPLDVIADYGVDGLRYFLLREIDFGSDGDFSAASLKARYNAELANNLGNLFSRTLTLIEKNFDGTLTAVPEGALIRSLAGKASAIELAFEQIAVTEVLEILGSVVTDTNKFIDSNAPWKLVKEDKDKAGKVLAECLGVLRWLACAYSPFMPASAGEMWRQIGEDSEIDRDGYAVFKDPTKGLSPAKKVRRGAVLFQRK